MTNSVEIQSVKATLIRLAYGMNTELDDQLRRRVQSVVTRYVTESKGRQLSQFLIQPVLIAVAEYPQRPAPFNVLQCLLLELQQWKTAESVLRASATALKTLVGLFSAERLPSLSITVYAALQACISLLDGRLKPPAVDAVASACFTALESNDWVHKVGAMEVLATLVRVCACGNSNEKENNRTLLTDFLDLAATIAQRRAQFDPSKRVREAAMALLSSIEHPVGTTVDGDTSKKENSGRSASAESVEPVVVESTTKSRNNSKIEKENEFPIALALTPLPEFSKERSEDELCGWRKPTATTPEAWPLGEMAASPSIGSVPNNMIHQQQHSPDAFSMLGSDMKSLNSAIEMDIENFLRGSILPVTGNLQKHQQHLDVEEEEEDEDVYSEGWDDILNPCFLNYENTEEEEESFVAENLKIKVLLAKALEEHFSGNRINFSLTTEEIEEILRTVLDIHSEQAYEHHLQRAEELLVRTSQQLEGKPQADAELQRRVQALENDVHRAVAEQQAQFMESAVPEIADILANPQALERLFSISATNC